jgi:hypothetical protein
MSTVNTAIAFMLGIATSCVAAQTLEPPTRPNEIRGEGTLRIQPAVGLRMGQLFVRLETTRLSDVLKSAERGTIGHHGDAGRSEYFLCFTQISGPRSSRVWLISHGEMGGSDHAVTEVFAQRIETSDAASDRCPPLPSRLQPIALDRGIWLGITRNELLTKLGQPSASRDDWLTFNFLGTVPGRYRPPGDSARKVVDWDITNILEARLKDGRINAILASRVTSY